MLCAEAEFNNCFIIYFCIYIYIVFTSKRLPLQPVSSEGNHQVADKFRKASCLNVYGWKRGRQTMHAFLPFLRLFIKCFFR